MRAPWRKKGLDCCPILLAYHFCYRPRPSSHLPRHLGYLASKTQPECEPRRTTSCVADQHPSWSSPPTASSVSARRRTPGTLPPSMLHLAIQPRPAIERPPSSRRHSQHLKHCAWVQDPIQRRPRDSVTGRYEVRIDRSTNMARRASDLSHSVVCRRQASCPGFVHAT